MCDKQVQAINGGRQTIAWARYFFSHSYRHPLITGHAAKRFGRLLRAGKIYENFLTENI